MGNIGGGGGREREFKKSIRIRRTELDIGDIHASAYILVSFLRLYLIGGW